MEMPPAPVVTALEKCWQRPVFDQLRVFHTREFHQLAKACRALYGAGTSAREQEVFQRALENIFRNANIRWFGNFEMTPEAAAVVVDRAFRQTRWPVKYVVSLDSPVAFPKVVFGSSAAGIFQPEQLAEILAVKQYRWFSDAERDEVEDRLDKLAQHRWLVVEAQGEEHSLATRVLGGVIGSVGGITPFLDLETIDAVAPHAGKFPPAVERALFALIASLWEAIDDVDYLWPFRVGQLYMVALDPIWPCSSIPSEKSLCWRPVMSGDGENIEGREPDSIDAIDDSRFDRLQQRTVDIHRFLETVTPVGGPHHAGFNPFMLHFFLRAYEDEEMDKLVTYCTSIEAALGRQEPSNTKKLVTRISKLLGDDEAGKEFERLYNARCEYVHGRPLGQGGPPRGDRRSAGQHSRKNNVKLLTLLATNPMWSRDTLLDQLT
jgi:hypothetical protein